MQLPSDIDPSGIEPETQPRAGDREPSDQLGFRQYRAPKRHGEVFVEPSFSFAPDLIADNARLARGYGAPFDALRLSARQRLIRCALDYTSVYRDVSWVDAVDTSSIIMGGHQPALFHPGVWFKNFALSRLAEVTESLAINLVVDNDVASGSSIRVPTVDVDSDQARYVSVPYDDAGGGVPYEQTTIQNRDLFDSFDAHVGETIGPIVSDPSVGRLWTHARAAVERCGVAGCALAQARHALEDEIRLRTLEVPLGVLCRGPEFAEFALGILTELPRFNRCYNEAADHYRAVHGIRSSAHPVPNLAQEDQWYEAPLWIYGDDAPTRRAAWARLSNDELILSDRGQPAREIRIDIRHPKLAAEQLAAAVSPRFKLRPRALLTTMYSRLVLSDLFLHGIGGAKYDQLGDRIIQAYFGITPPRFMVISATVQLPGVTSPERTDVEIRKLRRLIRDTRFQGERFAHGGSLSPNVELDPKLVQRKLDLLQSIPARGHRLAWQKEISEINASLSRSLAATRADLQQQLVACQRRAAADALLASREHPFCLFPLDYLTSVFEPLLPPPKPAP